MRHGIVTSEKGLFLLDMVAYLYHHQKNYSIVCEYIAYSNFSS